MTKYICKKCNMEVSTGINGQYVDLAIHMQQNHKTKYDSLLGDKKFKYFTAQKELENCESCGEPLKGFDMCSQCGRINK